MIGERLNKGSSTLAALFLFIGAGGALSDATFDGAAAREVNAEPPALAALAGALTNGPDQERRAFARIAVVEMSAAYQTELERANKPIPKTQTSRNKLARWRFATRRYLTELHEISGVLDSSDSVRLHVDQQQRVMIFIGNHPIIVNGPRIGKKGDLEKRILENFCLAHPCAAYLDTDEEKASAQEPRYPVAGTWALGQKRRPRYETVDGLLFEFRDMSERAHKERACLDVIPELRTLAAALKKAHEAGYTIDWRRIVIEPLPGSEDQRVVLNPQGDYLRLSLPRLEQAEGLWREALPWLRARAKGQDYFVRFRRSERLLQTASLKNPRY